MTNNPFGRRNRHDIFNDSDEGRLHPLIQAGYPQVMESFYQMLEAGTDAIALANHLRVQKFLDSLTVFTGAMMEATNQPPSQ